jgi:hypothetical protein
VGKRQYKAGSGAQRNGFYELMKWRSHAIKFAVWQRQQYQQSLAFAMGGDPRTTSYQKNFAFLRGMLASRSFVIRWAILLRILVVRTVLRARVAMRGSYRPKSLAVS